MPFASVVTLTVRICYGPAMPTIKVRGGDKLRRVLKDAKAAQRSQVKRLAVGFFETARYPDGTPVAAVAAWNEYGTKRIPERPFFRQALDAAVRPVSRLIENAIDPKELVVDKILAGRIGETVKGEIEQRIVDLREPANAPSTIAKKGSSNPLIGKTSTMRQSVTWDILRR